MTVTAAQVKAAIEILRTVADLIKALGQVPSGELYARLLEPLPQLTCETYLAMIDKMKEAKLIRVESHLITWIAPR